jgi:hypothetical protein
MSNWKSLGINLLLAAIVAILAVKVFVPRGTSSEKIEAMEMRLSSEIANLRNHLEHPQEAEEWKTVLDNLNQIAGTLNEVKSQLAVLDQRIKTVNRGPILDISAKAPGPGMFPGVLPGEGAANLPRPSTTPPALSTDWRSELSQEQRSQVDAIFKDHMSRLGELLPKPGTGEMLQSDELKKIMETEVKKFQDEMKRVLTPAQYEKFVSSMPILPLVFQSLTSENQPN